MKSLRLTKIRQPKETELYVGDNYDKAYTFVSGKNQITGQPGWRPKEIPGFDPVIAAMVPHDIMEHFPQDQRGVHNEYQALGAMFWLRFEGGYFGNARPSDVMVTPAFGMLFQHIVRHELVTKACPVVQESQVPLHFANTEYEMLRTLAECSKFVNATFTHKKRDRIYNSLDHALGWMRIGYRRAELRYARLNQKRLCELYRLITNQVGRVDPTRDGSEITITVHRGYKASLLVRENIKVTA